jgi:hypothetical protein
MSICFAGGLLEWRLDDEYGDERVSEFAQEVG